MEKKNQEERKYNSRSGAFLETDAQNAYQNMDKQLRESGNNRFELFSDLKKRENLRIMRKERMMEINILKNEISSDQELLKSLEFNPNSERRIYITKMLSRKREKLSSLLDDQSK